MKSHTRCGGLPVDDSSTIFLAQATESKDTKCEATGAYRPQPPAGDVFVSEKEVKDEPFALSNHSSCFEFTP